MSTVPRTRDAQLPRHHARKPAAAAARTCELAAFPAGNDTAAAISPAASFCTDCGGPLDRVDVVCSVCCAAKEAFPWACVGQQVVIGSDDTRTRAELVRVGCGAPEDGAGGAWVGCRQGYDHAAERDFIPSCADGVSRTHASIVPQQNGTFLVTNLSKTNATRVELEEVPPGGLEARVGQRVAIGQWDFVLGAAWPPRGFRRGTWRLPLAGLSVHAHGKPLLNAVSLVVERAELVALMGPSGAGKTTLLYALARIKLAAGAATENEDLARFWGSLGYVPQDDILHADLTVAQALRYTARLRLPAGTTAETIERRISWVLEEVGLTGKERTRIGSADEKTLSGGERRRVSLAAALVTNPQVLILDEPTSGLSWTDATRVVDCLKKLAENRSGAGRSIIVTIHQPDVQEFDKFHQVALLAKSPGSKTGARLVYFGPPSMSYAFFQAGAGRPPQIFEKIDGAGAVDADATAERFAGSEIHRKFVAARLGRDLTEEARRRGDPPPRPSPLAQFFVLLSRLWTLRFARARGLALLLGVALVLGGVSRLGKSDRAHAAAYFGCDPDRPPPPDECADAGKEQLSCGASPRPGARLERISDPRAGLLSTLMAIFLPLLVVSAGALVSERTIFRNEAIGGVRAGPYLLARFVELFVIGSVFMTIVMGMAMSGLGVAGDRASYLAVGLAVVAGALSLGLFVSALVPRAELALWAVNLLAIPQILFAGAHARLHDLTDLLSRLTVTRPALEALVRIDLEARPALDACQIDRYFRLWPGYAATSDPPLTHLATALLPFTLVCLAGAYLALRLRQARERRF
jgi:ABC-type multidrug transport system ATPase subunit